MRTWITIDKKAFENNVKLLKEAITPSNLAIVLKSNAYGHGLTEIGYLADINQNIDLICTAGISEALLLRNQNIKKRILVLSFFDDNLESAIKENIELIVYNLEQVIELNKIAQQLKKKAYIHIKIDTGMCRLGIYPKDIISFIHKIKNSNFIKISGIFTHLNDTNNPDIRYSLDQISQFEKCIDYIKSNKIEINNIHIFSSSGLSIPYNDRYNLVRAGALIYGLWKSDSHKQRVLQNYPKLNDLVPILNWKTKIIQIKDITKDSFIGYDKTFKAERNMKIGVIPIGYTDGLSRSLSNKGYVLVNGVKAQICGIISMNLTTIDLSNIPIVNTNDEVTIIGNDVEAFSLAKTGNIITNELVSRINPLIPKKII